MNTNRKSSQYLTLAGILFFIFLFLCFALSPQIFREDLGISNYAINPLTIVPYFLAFLSSATSLLLAANSLAKSSPYQRMATLGLRTIAILQLALLSVPKGKNGYIEHLHIGIAATLFVAEFILASWLVLRNGGKTVDRLILATQALAGVSAYLSLIHILSSEAVSQLVFQLLFIILCVLGIRRVEKQSLI